MAHCSTSKIATLLLLVLLQSLLLTHHITSAKPITAVKITQIPSNPRIALGVNESVLLQIHIKGEVHGVRSMVDFGGAPQDSCMGNWNYLFQLESKPLVKNLSTVCDQTHWANQVQHRLKYEVRITNGEAARQVDRVTIRLNVYRFEGLDFLFWSPQFEVTMLKSVATTTTKETAPVTSMEDNDAMLKTVATTTTKESGPVTSMEKVDATSTA